ncbi:MAG: arginine--tRNA ligase [Catonella sp.]|uniref:arginine--tRNA ligase n=1 Tax=Catonella sp. TaxID=2382125 RepID=UPI003F9F9D6C
MKKISVVIKETVEKVFVSLGYDKKYGMVGISNRPDLCQYQCNGAMAAVKEYKKAPLDIANEVADKLKLSEEGRIFEKIEVVKPGFINLTLKDEYLADYVNKMGETESFGYENEGNPKKIVIDYGGPNVAKPLHIGHLRSAIIGESIKRIERFAGNEVIGDVHLGDWGLQMGLIITEVKHRNPELVYFDEGFTGEYPKEAPFTIGELEEIYPTASAKSKEDEEYRNEALSATALLQSGNRGYIALWNHILSVSVADLKKNYDNLNVSFDLWKKESDAQAYIPDMVEKMKADGFAHMSEGALVVDVTREDDKKEVPPCIILKSDGASLYSTTDLATIVERVKLFNPTDILYVVDKRQEMHFEQVFRTAKKTGIAPENLNLTFLGFGTMNGKDGKPFKTREGGVMRLERLISEITEEVEIKMSDRDMDEEVKHKVARQVGLAALKYGDLSNQASKDYIFDLDRFASFEGNTGPYIQYTVVRIRSILDKFISEKGITKAELDKFFVDKKIVKSVTESERNLELVIAKFSDMIDLAATEFAPHKVCAYIYEMANCFSAFYHENHILNEQDEDRKYSLLKLSYITEKIIVKCLDLLGIDAPERM